MNLLILGLNYAPEPVGIGPYTTGLAEAMAARGHRVSAVVGKPYYPQWRAYPDQPRGVTRTNENGVRVIRVPHYIPAKPSGAKRIAHHASFAANAWRPALAQASQGADLVLAVAPSLLSVPVAARAAVRAGARLWIHLQDFEVEAAFATGLLQPQSLSGRLAGQFESRALQRADMVSTISPQMTARLIAKGIASDRTFELRNWSRSDLDFAATDSSRYRREWGLEGRKVALYSGNIANKQGLELVIEAARRLQTRDDIVFVICGEGPNRAHLEARAEGLGNVQFHDLQPPDRLSVVRTFGTTRGVGLRSVGLIWV